MRGKTTKTITILGCAMASGIAIYNATFATSSATFNPFGSTINGQNLTNFLTDGNVVYANGGNSLMNETTATKTGDASDPANADCYGTNAAVLTDIDALSIGFSAIISNGFHANGVFATTSTIDIVNSSVTVSGEGSGALMVSNNGIIRANGNQFAQAVSVALLKLRTMRLWLTLALW